MNYNQILSILRGDDVFINDIDLSSPISKFDSMISLLKESNHGIYNKDERLKKLTYLITDSMKSKFEKLNGSKFQDISGLILTEVEIQAPYGKDETFDLKIIWDIVKESPEPEIRNKFFKYASCTFDFIRSKVNIGIVVCKDSTQTEQKFYDEVKYLIYSNINYILYHEVKHLLDRIDKKLVSTKNKHLDLAGGKYQSQDKEIYNFLLSLIGEFETIVDENPNISFTDAVRKSQLYHRILDPMDVDKRNKVKGKLVDFWKETYGLDNLF